MERTPSKYMVLVGVLFTSLASIIVRMSSSPALVISSYRMLFTVLILIIPVMIKDRDEIRSIGKKDLMLCVLSGIFLALHFASWIASIGMTTIANATILLSFSPILVALSNYFIFKEKLSYKAVIGIIMSLVGTMIIAFGSEGSTSDKMMIGNVLAALGGFFIAGYLVIGGIVRKTVGAGAYVFIVYSASVVVLFCLCFITGTPIYPYSPKEFAIFLALAVFCSVLGHTVYNWLMKYLSATLISVSSLCEPIFASTLALIIYKEFPNIYTLIGGFIIISGVYYYLVTQNK